MCCLAGVVSCVEQLELRPSAALSTIYQCCHDARCLCARYPKVAQLPFCSPSLPFPLTCYCCRLPPPPSLAYPLPYHLVSR